MDIRLLSVVQESCWNFCLNILKTLVFHSKFSANSWINRQVHETCHNQNMEICMTCFDLPKAVDTDEQTVGMGGYHDPVSVYEPAHEIMVLTTWATSDGRGESAHPRLKNEVTEEEKCHNLMTGLILYLLYCFILYLQQFIVSYVKSWR